MFRIFRMNRQKPGAVQDVQLRPAEQAGAEALDQRLKRPAGSSGGGSAPC